MTLLIEMQRKEERVKFLKRKCHNRLLFADLGLMNGTESMQKRSGTLFRNLSCWGNGFRLNLNVVCGNDRLKRCVSGKILYLGQRGRKIADFARNAKGKRKGSTN